MKIWRGLKKAGLVLALIAAAMLILFFVLVGLTLIGVIVPRKG